MLQIKVRDKCLRNMTIKLTPVKPIDVSYLFQIEQDDKEASAR